MKILVNVLQVLLALWTITGSVYMMGHYEVLASDMAFRALPGLFWVALGIVQIFLSIGLIVSVHSRYERYAAPSAIGLALIVLAGIVLYGSYTGPIGMLWAIVPALLLAFVAYRKSSE